MVYYFSDPYVKVWLQFGDKRIEKRKTAIFKCTLNPVFNDTFSFNVPWEKIRECSLDVMVMDFDNIGRNELIGRILLAGNLTEYLLSTLGQIICNYICKNLRGIRERN